MTEGKQPSGDGGQGGDSGGGGGDQSGGGGGDQGGGGTTQEPMITPSPIGEYEIREGDRGRIVEEGR